MCVFGFCLSFRCCVVAAWMVGMVVLAVSGNLWRGVSFAGFCWFGSWCLIGRDGTFAVLLISILRSC